MNRKKIVSLLCVISIIAASLCGCEEKATSPLQGNWAYIHDDETTILSLKENNKATYHKEKYSYEADAKYITLSSKGKEDLKLRYELNNDDLYLYEPAEYTYAGEGEPNGIIGEWVSENQWSFEFTENGTFREDGYFPGYYSLDEENGAIILVYNDHFEDAVVYYQIEGNKLKVEYPWRMVKK